MVFTEGFKLDAKRASRGLKVSCSLIINTIIFTKRVSRQNTYARAWKEVTE
jgi:hypothetical protein